MKFKEALEEDLKIGGIHFISDKHQQKQQNQKKKKQNNNQNSFSEELKKETARKFVAEVKDLAKKYNLNVFVVTDGASGTENNGNEFIKKHRNLQIQLEKENGLNPNEDWSKNLQQPLPSKEIPPIRLPTNKEIVKPGWDIVKKAYGIK